MASVSKDEYNAVLNSLTEGQQDVVSNLSNQNILDSIKAGAGGAGMSEVQGIAQNGLAVTQGPGSYNVYNDPANLVQGLQGQQDGRAQNISSWGGSTDYNELIEAGNLDAARTWTMNQYGQGNITAEEAQELENQAFEQQYGSLEHTVKSNSAGGPGKDNVLSGESWVETTYTPTDYGNLSQTAALNQGESHNVIQDEFVQVEGLGAQLFKQAVTGALTAGAGAALAPSIAGLSAGAQGAINGGLNSAIGGVVSGDGLNLKNIGAGALTGGVGGSLSNADGMLGGFIDTGSNLADDAIKGAITGGIGGAFDGDVLGGALMGGATGAGTNLLEQGVSWAGDKINGLKNDLTAPGEFDFANDVMDFEGDDFDQYMQQAELDALTEIIPSGEYHEIPDVVQDELDRQYMEDYNSLQEVVPGGEYREGIKFSETNNWITADGQAIDRNDVTFNQEIGEFTIQGTDTIVSEHTNAITIDGQVVAYKDGESWTDLSGEPVTDPALVDFYTSQSTQSGDMQLIQEATHDTLKNIDGETVGYQGSDGKWYETGSNGTVEIDPSTLGDYTRVEGTGNYIPEYSDNHGGSDNPDFGGTIFGESTQTSPGNNYTASDGKGWGIDTGDTNYADPGATQDIYYNLDNGFYDPDATNSVETNFLPPEEVVEQQQQQQQQESESDPVNNTDTSLDSGEKGGGTTGTPSNPTDTAVGTIVADLEQDKLQAILNNNVELANEIEKEIEKVKEAASSTENTNPGVDSSTPTNNDPSPAQPNNETGGTITQEQVDKIVEEIIAGGDPTGSTNPSGNPNATPGGQNTDSTGNGGLDDGAETGAGNDTGSGVQTGDGTGTGETGDKGGNGDGNGDPGIGAGVGGLLAGLGAGDGSGTGDGEGIDWTKLFAMSKLTPWQKRRHQIQRGLLESVIDTDTRRV